ncbi:hypothetical protein BH23GEM8_BH23GEM8_09820 [soil metagenome]
MTIDQIIGVITMRHGVVSAVGTMPVAGLMSPTIVVRGAFGWILSVHLEPVIIHVIFVRMMHVTVVKIVGVPIVHDGGMSTAGSVLVRVPLVFVVCHRAPPVGVHREVEKVSKKHTTGRGVRIQQDLARPGCRRDSRRESLSHGSNTRGLIHRTNTSASSPPSEV